jgi:hypothetical protein
MSKSIIRYLNSLVINTLNKLLRVLLIFSVMGLLDCISSCSPIIYTHQEYSGSADYKTFITPQGDNYPLSFEYPSYYKLGYEPNTPVGTLIRLEGVPLEDFFIGKVNYVDISIGHWTSNAEVSADEQISSTKSDWNRNFLLEEKREIKTPDRLDGWEIIMTYREKPIYLDNLGLHPRPPVFAVYREVFIDYQDVLCRIRLYADADSYKQSKQDFEHILRTLEIVKNSSSNVSN